MKKITSYFLKGLLLVAPFAITLFIIYHSFITIDGWLSDAIIEATGIHIPGLGIVAITCILIFLGVVGEFTIINPLKTILKRLIQRIPLLNLIYTSLQDLLSALVGKEKKFNTPVKVLINKENQLWKLGFITKKSLEELEEPQMSSVYFPHSYNFSGELFLIPNDQIIKINIAPSQAMKFIISGGVTNLS